MIVWTRRFFRDLQKINKLSQIISRLVRVQGLAPLLWDIFLTGSPITKLNQTSVMGNVGLTFSKSRESRIIN